MFVAPIVSLWLAPKWQDVVGIYFNSERFPVLRSLLASTGGALIGATAIGFSVVMVAVQLNFARMPHGLFRRLSSDPRLLGAFAATFLLAIGVSALSLMPDASWVALALTAAAWGTLLILYLFLYGYWRALHLLNPAVQLGFISENARKDLQRWSRRAERLAPLLPVKDDGAPPKLDLRRLAFYKANPQWTVQALRAVAHAISFARRYAEQNDFEVSGLALRVVVAINLGYIAAKGKTFVASNPVFDIPDASDAFINDTLEHLRRLARISTGRQSEEGTRQVLTTMAALGQAYLAIDYSTPSLETKEHSQLAASYLTGAVEGVLPTNSPDLIMEGVRLIGSSARGFLAVKHPNEITTLASKIAALSIIGIVKPDYRPVTLTAMEQLALITSDLIQSEAYDIGYAATELLSSVKFVVEAFLTVPDIPLTSTHSGYLAPYYSLAKTNALGERLTALCNFAIQADQDNEPASRLLRNFKTWSEELYRIEKSVLLLAIEKRSHFTFDSLHWIKHLTKLLVALSKAPAADDYIREQLERHALSLISVISWIPEDKETIQFVEGYSLVELLFEAAMDAVHADSIPVLKRCRELLIEWGFKTAAYTSRSTLERAILSLATLALWKEELNLVSWLKAEIAKRLNETPIDQDMLDRAARGLRQAAASLLRRREYETDRIRHAMNQLDRAKVQSLLKEVADTLSPNTAGEIVRARF